MFDIPIRGLEEFSPLFTPPGPLEPRTTPVCLSQQSDFRHGLDSIEAHHRSLGSLISGNDEIAEMFSYTGLLVRVHKQSKALDVSPGNEEEAAKLLQTLKELQAVASSLEDKIKARLGEKSPTVEAIDLSRMRRAITSWAEPETPVPPIPPEMLPQPKQQVEKAESAVPVVVSPPALSTPPPATPVFSALSTREEYQALRNHLTEIRAGLAKYCQSENESADLLEFDRAFTELDSLANSSSETMSSSEYLKLMNESLTRMQKAVAITHCALSARMNPENTLLAVPSMVRREKTLTFRVPVEHGNDVTFDFQGDPVLSMIARSGEFRPILHRFRQNETRIEGGNGTFTATRTFDKDDERFYVYTVTMSFYADPTKARLTISAPNAAGTGRDSVVLARRERENVRPPVFLQVPALDAKRFDEVRAALQQHVSKGLPAIKSHSNESAPAPLIESAFSFRGSDGKTFDTIDSLCTSAATRDIYRRAAEAGYEVEANGDSYYRIFKNMRTRDGTSVRLAVGEYIYLDPRSVQQVSLGNGRVSSDFRAVQFALVAQELAQHLDCEPVLIEKSIRPIDKSTCPELVSLLRSRPDLHVRYGANRKFGSGHIVDCEIVRTDERGNESIYTKVSLSTLSSEWGSERDSLIHAAILERDQHGSDLAAIRIQGSAVPDGLPIYQQLCPKTYQLLSVLEQQGRTVRCTACDDTWVTFTVVDSRTGRDICSINMNTWRFKDPHARDYHLPRLIESTMAIAEGRTQTTPAQAEIAAKLRSQINRPDYVSTVVDGALAVDDVSLIQGVERWHGLALAKHLSQLPSTINTFTQSELEEISTPLLHMLARIELKEPGYLKALAKQSPEALDRFTLLLAADIMKERKAMAGTVILDKNTEVVALFHTDKMFGPEALLNLALRVGVPVEQIMDRKNPYWIKGGASPHQDFLTRVETRSGNADNRSLFFISCHGLPGRIQTSNNRSQDISVKALAASLLKEQLEEVRAGLREKVDLSKKTLLLNTCYSYNIASELLYELHAQAGEVEVIPPIVMSTANRGMLSWGNEATTSTPMTDALLKNFPHGSDALTIGHLMLADSINGARFDRMLKAGAYITYRPLNLPMLLYTEDHAIFHRTKDLGQMLNRYEETLRRTLPELKSPKRRNPAGPQIPNELSHHQVNPRIDSAQMA